ncbi:hypothetical protein G3R49_19565 [Shewanella sp. WXL01]|uniref:hypothetical protein n=1 Tax=Shewanella sp. WXL01 TaxID=2709721 RepID=UPI0014385C38|nr:hypothetical protein [Shewanella sp. WXL01]NKF52758.1 hypothetical protein [Shewanella sp. WXL01]
MSKKLLALMISGILFGCGSSDDSPEPQKEPDPTPDPVTITGKFLDSAVIGIGYTTATQSGTTNENGEFNYVEGESVTFAIGDLTFPETSAKEAVTPLDIANTEDVTNNQVVNMARLLQTLDKDGDPSNGITITEDAAAAAEPVDFSQSPDEFAASNAVNAVITNGGQDTPVAELVSEEAAVDHLDDTLIEEGIQVGIVGTWTPVEDENELLGLVFFDDGTYIHYEVDRNDEEEVSGMEWGTYSRTADDGRVVAAQTFDENGDTGLTDFVVGDTTPRLFANVNEQGQLVAEFDEDADGTNDGSLSFNKQENDGLVGTWVAETISENDGEPMPDENDILAFVFNADGSYVHLEVDLDDETEESGMEWGTYTIDSESNQISVSITFDANGDTGFNDITMEGGPNIMLNVDGNRLTADVDEDNDGTVDTKVIFKRQ